MNKLMEKRKEFNLTREDLSKKTGVTVEKIRDLELSLLDVKEQDDKIVNSLAKVLNIEPLKLKQGCYYKYIGTNYRIAQLQYVVVTHEEWKKLKWKKSGIQMHHRHKYQKNGEVKEIYIKTNYDAAFVLGYKIFAGVNTIESDENIQECYIKDEKLYMFSLKEAWNDDIYMVEIPRKPEEVIIR
ncbi:helix-turn-helix domain-containing protein [Clostridium sp. MT-14]|uniref:helix-turn-helix domain-containing protein n=1 Tax=Clostridium sp. MT-14 TaxID=3348360 RepID=UPI0035F418A5